MMVRGGPFLRGNRESLQIGKDDRRSRKYPNASLTNLPTSHPCPGWGRRWWARSDQAKPQVKLATPEGEGKQASRVLRQMVFLGLGAIERKAPLFLPLSERLFLRIESILPRSIPR
jgi:hypothetical protein